jgi:5-methylcytosine-specific restriction protein A
MPKRPPRPCAERGCPTLVYSGSRCGEHLLPKDRSREAVRASSAKRGYGPAWKSKRDAWARSHPLCADPFSRHNEQLVSMKIVDHIIPLSQGGRDDETNYQSLCMACHNYKTAHDGSRRKGRGRGG